MNALEDADQETWNAIKSGDSVVAKSEILFSLLFTDQTQEQEIKKIQENKKKDNKTSPSLKKS